MKEAALVILSLFLLSFLFHPSFTGLVVDEYAHQASIKTSVEKGLKCGLNTLRAEFSQSSWTKNYCSKELTFDEKGKPIQLSEEGKRVYEDICKTEYFKNKLFIDYKNIRCPAECGIKKYADYDLVTDSSSKNFKRQYFVSENEPEFYDSLDFCYKGIFFGSTMRCENFLEFYCLDSDSFENLKKEPLPEKGKNLIPGVESVETVISPPEFDKKDTSEDVTVPRQKPWETGGMVPPKFDVPWDSGSSYSTPQPSTKLVPFTCGDFAHVNFKGQMIKQGEVPEGTRVKCECDPGFKGVYPNCVPDCGPNARGIIKGDIAECACNEGYVLHNNQCVPKISPDEVCKQLDVNAVHKNGQCVCMQGYEFISNKCVEACNLPKFRNEKYECVSCDQFCQSKGMTSQQMDYSAYIQDYLNKNGVCKERAQIQGGNALSVTGTNCNCFDKNPPKIELSGLVVCRGTPCGDVPCNQVKSCPYGSGVLTVSCNWGGWKYIPGKGAVPIVQAGAQQQDVQMPSN